MKDGQVRIAMSVIHRERAVKKGFTHRDFSVWIEVVTGWLYSLGAVECSVYTSPDPDEDEILVCAVFAQEPDSVLLADIVMKRDAGFRTPMRLEDYEPSMVEPFIAAYRRQFEMFAQEREQVTKLATNFVDQLQSVISVIKTRVNLDPARMGDNAVRLQFAKWVCESCANGGRPSVLGELLP